MTTDVYQRLREAILHLELEPGSRISQLELTRHLGVSRTPLREALRLLEREGLIEPSTPHGLVVIKPLSMDDVEDLYSVRVYGEALAISLTVPMLDAAACTELARLLRIIDKGEKSEVRDAHRRFHEGLRIGAGDRLQSELRHWFDHAERYQLASIRRKRRTRAQAEHRAILRACRKGDRHLAADLLIDHCATTAYELIKVEEADRPTPVLDAAVSMTRAGLDKLD
jgi:DNA-binding GntR family transcriptional regulator